MKAGPDLSLPIIQMIMKKSELCIKLKVLPSESRELCPNIKEDPARTSETLAAGVWCIFMPIQIINTGSLLFTTFARADLVD